MDPRPHPSKEEVRAWMARRGRTGLPPPAPDEIRRELGWHLLPAAAPPSPSHGLPKARSTATPVAQPVALPPMLPLLFAELAALTAVAWCWLALHQSAERRR